MHQDTNPHQTRTKHPETCRKPAEISAAQELGTASGRGLTPRNLQKTCRNQPRPRTGDGKRQGTYSQKRAENVQNSAPPKNWGRQAAGDLHPETYRKPAEISPAQELGTASGRGLTPRNLQKTCRNQSRPRTGDGKRQGTYTQKPAENLQKSVPPKNWGRQAAGDLHPETCRKPAELSPAQELGTASGRGLTARNLQKTCRNQSRQRTGHGTLQGTYTQKPAENLQKSAPPKNWGRQAAGHRPKHRPRPRPKPYFTCCSLCFPFCWFYFPFCSFYLPFCSLCFPCCSLYFPFC